ncbi:MAG: hypothetical protein ACP5IL_08590 [Syntrophobacteraceae bacterium]
MMKRMGEYTGKPGNDDLDGIEARQSCFACASPWGAGRHCSDCCDKLEAWKSIGAIKTLLNIPVPATR